VFCDDGGGDAMCVGADVSCSKRSGLGFLLSILGMNHYREMQI